MSLVVLLVTSSLPWGADAQGRGRTPQRAAAAVTGLHRVGNQIRDANDVVLRLRGVNEPSGEYACIYNYGVFNHSANGISDAASAAALASWKINVVRLPLNESCWLGINGAPAAYSGVTNYQTPVKNYVNTLTAAGIAVILDLHWVGPGNTLASQPPNQVPMPDRDHAIAFWQQVASSFKSNTGVIFDLYNEPYPAGNVDSNAAWTCLRDGSPGGVASASCPGSGFNYNGAGIPELVQAVRGTGATNLLMLPGVTYTGHLSQWLTYMAPLDSNIAASVHIYPGGSQCSDLACINTELGPIVQSYPLIADELGQQSCAVDQINPVIDWLESKSQHFLAWQWVVGSCDGSDVEGNYYGLLFRDPNHPNDASAYGSGTPSNGYGTGYKNRLAALVGSQPSFTSSATVQPTTVTPGNNLSITASVTDTGGAATVVVVVYEYNPSGNFFDQQFFTSQTFAAGQTRQYPVTWPVPAGAASGGWTIRIGVFEQTFNDLLYWNDNAAQFTVAPANPTPTRTATPTATPVPIRPAVGVQVAPNAGTLQATITARDANCAQGNNQLQSLQFTRIANAAVDVGSPLIATVTAAGPVALPSHPASIPLTVRRSNASQPVTIELIVTDGCGTWPTFIGGGPSAF